MLAEPGGAGFIGTDVGGDNLPMPSPIVLIAPAMAIGSRYYRPLVEEFESLGWASRALPRRGFEQGERQASRSADWSYADEIGDIAAGVAAARAEDAERPVIVLGHSLGGQLLLGHQQTQPPADGLVMIGAAIPHHRNFPRGGLHLLLMGGIIVPVTTTLLGHLPKPAFGAPGARTLMREWGRMAVTGRTPFPINGPIDTPSLVISLEGDTLAPLRAVDTFARDLFEPSAVTRWHYRDDEVPEGGSNHHITWVRSPEVVVDRVVAWWAKASA